jgi:folate-binding protein YgfZ
VRRLDDAVVAVRGADAQSWLQGQVTNDLGERAPGDAVYALVLNARGRILSDAWILVRDVELLLVLPRAAEAGVLAHFDAHLVMEDVELAALPCAVVTVQGPQAREVIDVAGVEGYPCDRLGFGGFDVLVDADDDGAALIAAAARLGGGEVGEDAWELARLRAGHPRFAHDFGERAYPQEAGLAARAVSFHKGCYLGQEVVCMLENRGQLTRRLAMLESERELAPGTKLYADGKPAGEITSSVRDPERDRHLALGYVKRALLETSAPLDEGITVRAVVGA